MLLWAFNSDAQLGYCMYRYFKVKSLVTPVAILTASQ